MEKPPASGPVPCCSWEPRARFAVSIGERSDGGSLMKTKFAFVAGALALGLAAPMLGAGAAYAQCSYGERVDGTTADMARAKAQRAGYTNVVMNRKGCDSYWHGTANQGGARVGIVVSPAGQVMVESQLDQPPGMSG